MKLRQRSQQVFEAIKEGGKRSIRKIAEATGIAKSSVHRHKQALERRNQYPESALWSMAAGGQWLRLKRAGNDFRTYALYKLLIMCINGNRTLQAFLNHHLISSDR